MRRQARGIYHQAQATAMTRVVVLMPAGEAEAIDAWGVPVGMPSRTAAVRTLLRKGLDAVSTSRAASAGGESAAGNTLQG